MELRNLGRSGLSIAPLMFGGNVFGWTVNEETAHTLLDAFVDGGFNAIDTADAYSRWVPGHPGGESESIIGTWLKQSGKRNKVVIATKVGADMGQGRTIRAKYILQSVEGSLQRLQVDTIDLYQTHFDDEITPVEETLGAYAQLIKDGKVRAIGASNVKPGRLKAALAASKAQRLPRYETLQPNYNLYDRNTYEIEYEPIARKEGLGVIPYYALASGFLTGKYRSLADAQKNEARGAKVRNYFDARGLLILKTLDRLSAKHEATPAQIALAWLIGRPSVVAPIVSATSHKQLHDIMQAPRLKLTKDDVAELDKTSETGGLGPV